MPLIIERAVLEFKAKTAFIEYSEPVTTSIGVRDLVFSETVTLPANVPAIRAALASALAAKTGVSPGQISTRDP